jgi:hypothetical protein
MRLLEFFFEGSSKGLSSVSCGRTTVQDAAPDSHWQCDTAAIHWQAGSSTQMLTLSGCRPQADTLAVACGATGSESGTQAAYGRLIDSGRRPGRRAMHASATGTQAQAGTGPGTGTASALPAAVTHGSASETARRGASLPWQAASASLRSGTGSDSETLALAPA